ncbi:MAG: DUF4126 domain-containing protein [Bacteroidota bacterium]
MGLISTLGLALGASWASGLRLYAAVAALGLLGRFAGLDLPGELAVLETPWVIGLAMVLLVVEFVADKVPLVDSTWDAIHTFIRIPAGAAIAALAFGDYDPQWQAAAVLLGGGAALSAHGSKAATRLAVNTSPEPVSNMVVSTTEDGLAIGAVLMAVFLPLVALVLVGLAMAVSVWLLPRIVRAVRRQFHRGETHT